MSKDIIPECYIDTALVESLLSLCGALRGGVNHQKGCNTVAKTMKEKFGESFALGVIDEDKRQPKYCENFGEICRSEHLSIKKHKGRPHFLVVVRPAMDRFIFDCVDDLNNSASNHQINLSDYDLPSSFEEFKSECKRVASKQDPRFRRLFSALRTHEEMKRLQDLLCYLVQNSYQADLDHIRRLF